MKRQEDADMISLSILSAPTGAVSRIVDELQKREMADVILFAGGIIPDEDRDQLQKMGFKGIFGPGASTLDIIDWVKNNTPSAAAA
jgi:methylmalonyl-CoA mutase C-terminal domain/subunit